MSEAVSPSHLQGSTARRPDRSFVLLLLPLAAVSAPSLLFCALTFVLRLHGSSTTTMYFHLPAQTAWDRVFALETAVCGFVARWNSVATLAATAFFVSAIGYAALAQLPGPGSDPVWLVAVC